VSSDATVFVVDDDPAVRTSLADLMTSIGIPVECYPSAQEFLDAFDPSRGGCLVADVRMPGISGIELQERLCSLGADIAVILLTGHGDVPMAVQALKRGAIDFLEKPCRPQVLLDRIQHALQVDAKRRTARVEEDEVARRLSTLTQRERRVVEMIASGMTTKAIAAEFQVSTQAVDAHRSRAMKKLNVNTVPTLAVLVADAVKRQSSPAASPQKLRSDG